MRIYTETAMQKTANITTGTRAIGARVAVVFWLVLLLVVIFTFSESVFGRVRPEAISAFLGISFGALMLTAAGWAIATLARLRFIEGNCALQIGVGQIAITVWIFFRSVLNAGFEYLSFVHVPITVVELMVGIGILVTIAYRKYTFVPVPKMLPGFVGVVVAIFIITQRELPREIMLSTDPDQHLFWTIQLLKFGAVPFDLGDWGPLGFQYPAGFAAISAIWAWLTHMTAANSVTIQPLLQSTLAVLAIAGLAIKLLTKDDARTKIVGGYIALALFFGFFPYSLLKEFFILQKTGSISSLLLLVTVLVLIVEASIAPQALLKKPGIYFAGLGVGLSALLNPVAMIAPGFAYCVALLREAWRLRDAKWKIAILLGVLGSVPIITMLADPYYLSRFILHRSSDAPLVPPGFVVSEFAFGSDAYAYAAKLIMTFEWARPFMLLQYFAHPLAAIATISMAVAVSMWLLRRESRKSALAWMVIIPLSGVVLEFFLLPVFYALRNKGDFYLLEPYFIEAVNRVAYLWYVGILLVALILVFRKVSEFSQGAVVFIAIFTAMMIPVRQARDHLPNDVRMDNRISDCRLLDCDPADDRIVIRALRTEYEKYVNAPNASDSRMIPRVLVLNELIDVWRERWLFPVGISRVLPAMVDFPLAFYYYKGHPDFTYQNYVKHVCERFDRKWLQDRRVQYVFVPSEREKACVADLDDLLSGPGILSRSGNSALIQIF